jgi:hypothetical protein
LARFFLPPTLRARAVNQEVVAAVPNIKAVERSASRFGPKPLLPKAEEELIVAVACQESTRTQGVTLKANETETKSDRCRAVLIRAQSSVSCAFVVKQQVETKKGGAGFKSPPSRKTQEAFHRRQWNLSLSSTLA